MPTILESKGYKFKFFSNENEELPHVHGVKGEGHSKIWLVPALRVEYSYNFTVRENRDIWNLIFEIEKPSLMMESGLNGLT